MNILRKHWIAALVISIGSVAVSPSAQAQTRQRLDEPSPRKFADIKKDIVAFSKRVADREDTDQRLDSILDLCLLYMEIVTDQRFPTSQTLQGYSRRVHYRLNETKKYLERERVRYLPGNESELALETNDEHLQAAALGISDQLMLMSRTHGGPQYVVDMAGGFFGGVLQSNADDLIRLIESTLHPDSWENNGGVGTIRYWSQSMVLVVRATTEVHEDLERFLNMLRYSR